MKVPQEEQALEIISVAADDCGKTSPVETPSATYEFPYTKLEVPPSPEDRVAEVHVDEALEPVGVTYTLESGQEGTVHVDQVLHYIRETGIGRSYFTDDAASDLNLAGDTEFKEETRYGL